MSYGKQKGNSFERIVAGLMDSYFKVPSKTFWRSLASGSWEPEQGDVVIRDWKVFVAKYPSLTTFYVAIECKNVKDVDVLTLITADESRRKAKRSNNPYLWVSQVEKEARSLELKTKHVHGRLLFFKQNKSEIYVMISRDHFFSVCSYISDDVKSRYFSYHSGSLVYVVVPWKLVAAIVPVEVFIGDIQELNILVKE